MKDFRNDLLEMLLEKSGEYLSIMDLVEKHCGGLVIEDETKGEVKCRLNINGLLAELKEMGWIAYYPPGGLSASHKMNHDLGKRVITMNVEVKAKLTTKGEIEYKQIKKEQKPPKSTIHIGEGFTGIFINESQLSEMDFRPEINPIIKPVIVQNTDAPKTGIMTRIGKFIIKNIIAIIVTVVSGVIVGFILWKLGWI